MKKVIPGLILILFSIQIYSQEQPQEIIEKFFKTYESTGPSNAIDEIYETNPWRNKIQDAIDNIKTQLESFDVDLVGKYYGYEKLATKKLGDSFELDSYFIKFDRQFLRLTFEFYKPNKEWRLYSFKFDDSFDQEIEEAARLYYVDLNEK